MTRPSYSRFPFLLSWHRSGCVFCSLCHSLRVRRFSKLQFFVVENGIQQRDRDAIALGGLSFRGVFQPQEPILCFSRLRLHVPQDRPPHFRCQSQDVVHPYFRHLAISQRFPYPLLRFGNWLEWLSGLGKALHSLSPAEGKVSGRFQRCHACSW